MAQWLRVLTTLPEDLGTKPTWQVTTVCSSSSREPDAHGKTPMHIKTNKQMISSVGGMIMLVHYHLCL